MNIAAKLLSLRSSKGFSQGDVEKRTGLLRCYLSRVENGHTIPSLETLERLAAALEIEMYQLFFEGGGKPVAPDLDTQVDLATNERHLLEAYRRLSARDKEFAAGLLRKMGKGDKKSRRRNQ